jgi:hypothetical protein
MVVKTFRGLLADGGQDQIRLSTIKGKVGYKIIKFQFMPKDIDGSNSHEDLISIWKEEQTTLLNDVDFTDSSLLAAGYYVRSLNPSAPYVATISESITIFDNETFNQDIYVTMKSGQGANLNYYIELEVIPLDDAGAEYMTLKDMRQA